MNYFQILYFVILIAAYIVVYFMCRDRKIQLKFKSISLVLLGIQCLSVYGTITSTGLIPFSPTETNTPFTTVILGEIFYSIGFFILGEIALILIVYELITKNRKKNRHTKNRP